MKYPTKYLG